MNEEFLSGPNVNDIVSFPKSEFISVTYVVNAHIEAIVAARLAPVVDALNKLEAVVMGSLERLGDEAAA